MEAVAWVTVILATLIVLAAALGLFRVVMHLVAVNRTLGEVVVGVQAVAEKTSTVPTVLPSVNAKLHPVRSFTESI